MKVFHTEGVRVRVADDITLTFPYNQSVAVLGRNGAGKSSLLKMIAGTMRPTSGRIRILGNVSWPVGFAGSFHGDLTGLQNTRFVARIYGVDSDQLIDFVWAFSELGEKMRMPLRSYSQGMRARLAFALSMGIDFDTYLIDEISAVGDAAFREKCETALIDRLDGKSAIVVSHNLAFLKRVCDAGVVMEEGQAAWFSDLTQAISLYSRNLA